MNKFNIDNLMDYINTHYTDKDISLQKLARLFFYTERHISFLFQKNTGEPFRNYLLKLRMAHAKSLIDNGEQSVSKIARDSGFKDPLYFSKVFAKFYGISPKLYIKASRVQDKD